jgi:hypothetical protein
MDVSLISSPHDSGSNPLGRALAVQHERVRDFLAAQRERVERIEAELAQRIQQCQEELREQQVELAAREATLAAAEDAVELRQQELERTDRQQQAEAEQLQALREAIAQRSAELDTRQEEVEAQRIHTEAQRRRIARELRAQQQAQRAELNRRRNEVAGAQAERPVQAVPPHPEPVRAAPVSVSGRLNWEAEKRQLLAALEEEEAGGKPAAHRTEIDEVIRATERALADKDRELTEMRQILDSQSSNLGQLAVGAAALGQVLDQDSLIREERENLRRLQQEWEEKSRKAEIEISLERAKLARQRAELEEKLQAFDQQRQGQETPGPSAATPAKPARGRWLARLGLKEDKDAEGDG